MFNIIHVPTGKVVGVAGSANMVSIVLNRLVHAYPMSSLFVSGNCESGFGLSAFDWLAAEN